MFRETFGWGRSGGRERGRGALRLRRVYGPKTRFRGNSCLWADNVLSVSKTSRCRCCDASSRRGTPRGGVAVRTRRLRAAGSTWLDELGAFAQAEPPFRTAPRGARLRGYADRVNLTTKSSSPLKTEASPQVVTASVMALMAFVRRTASSSGAGGCCGHWRCPRRRPCESGRTAA